MMGITYLVIVFLHGVSCLKQGEAENYHPSNPDRLNTPDTQGNLVVKVDSDCRKLSLTDHNHVHKDLLLGRIQYTTEDGTDSELNLVEALAEESNWEEVGTIMKNINPKIIRQHHKDISEELKDSSRRLFKKLEDIGYKDEFGWDAYIQGFKNTGNPNLNRIIEDLEEMLDCLGLSRTSIGAVTLARFNRMSCGGKELSLIEDMAEEWRSVAREFGVKEHLIFSQKNIPKTSAEEVVTKFYTSAFTWQEIIDILYEARRIKIAKSLEEALKNYCDKAN